MIGRFPSTLSVLCFSRFAIFRHNHDWQNRKTQLLVGLDFKGRALVTSAITTSLASKGATSSFVYFEKKRKKQ